jgi:hypothetical protein
MQYILRVASLDQNEGGMWPKGVAQTLLEFYFLIKSLK